MLMALFAAEAITAKHELASVIAAASASPFILGVGVEQCSIGAKRITSKARVEEAFT